MITSLIARDVSIIPKLVDMLRDGHYPLRITIQPHKKKRSLAQNALFWLWVERIKNHVQESTGQLYSNSDIHDLLVDMFLPKKIIEFRNRKIEKQLGTSDLNTTEMMEFLDKVDMYCADRLNLQLPHPEDLYLEARG